MGMGLRGTFHVQMKALHVGESKTHGTSILRREPRDEESAGDVTVSAILSDSLASNKYFEARTVSEASRWSAEVDEVERLLDANV